MDDKDDNSSRSIQDDEENALPPSKEEDAEKSDQKEESQPQANGEHSIPNGGLKAWLQVLGSFMLFFNTFGILKYVPPSLFGQQLRHYSPDMACQLC